MAEKVQKFIDWLHDQDEDTLWVWHHKYNEVLTNQLWPTPEAESN
jgi:hypothetical protein